MDPGRVRRRSRGNAARHSAWIPSFLVRRRERTAAGCWRRLRWSSPLRRRSPRAAVLTEPQHRRRRAAVRPRRWEIRGDVKNPQPSGPVVLGRRPREVGVFSGLLGGELDRQEAIEQHDRAAEIHHEADRHPQHRRPRTLEEVDRNPERDGRERDGQLTVPVDPHGTRCSRRRQRPRRRIGRNIHGRPKSM